MTNPSNMNCPSQNISRVNKNLSPISILDNSNDSSYAFHNQIQKIMSSGQSSADCPGNQEYGGGVEMKTDNSVVYPMGEGMAHLNSFDHPVKGNGEMTAEGVVFKGNMNLSEHIRKINKI